MSTAYYSARAGCAFLQDSGSSWLRLNVKQPDRWEPCASWEVAIAFRGCTDVLEIPAQDKQRIQDALVHAVHVMNASDLTLWLLDATLSEKTRTSAACELNPFLSKTEIVEHWRGIFWWKPLGKDADLKNALRVASQVRAQKVILNLEDLRDRQAVIALVRHELEAVLASDAVPRDRVVDVRQSVQQKRLHLPFVMALGIDQKSKSHFSSRAILALSNDAQAVSSHEWWRRWSQRLAKHDRSQVAEAACEKTASPYEGIDKQNQDSSEAMPNLVKPVGIDDLSTGNSLDHFGTAPDKVSPGTRMLGKVVSVNVDGVLLELTGRARAVVPVEHFEVGKMPHVGVTLALVAEGYDAAQGLIRARVALAGVSKPQGNWDAVSAGQVVECVVTKTNKGGLEVKVSNLRGFMPATQVDVGYCNNLEQFVGQKVKACVLEIKPAKKLLIVSRRQYIESILAETREQIWSKLRVGQKVTGRVKTLKDYGAFIDIGGLDGLLHVTEMSWNRLHHPKDLLKEGQEVEVQILSLDRDTTKISLSLKQLTSSPWLAVMERYPIESTVRGKVTRTTAFGAFVELEPGLEGMVHISELDHKRVVRVTDILQVGKEVDLRVLAVDPNSRRIALSLKALITRPEASRKVADQDLTPGSVAPAYVPKRDRNRFSAGGGGGAGRLFGPVDLE
jgi:predicted RNA-binding protein with RPS1 domain